MKKKLSKTCIHFYILVKKEGLRPLLLLEDSAAEEFSGIDLTNPNCVLVGLAPSQFQYDKLNQAFKLGRVRFIGIFVSSVFRWSISLKGPGIQNS